MNDGDDKAADVSVRWPEVGVATLLLLIAGLVIADSLRVGTGWADDGPRSGYFPFYIGLMLAAAAAWTLIGQLLRWRRTTAVFAEPGQLPMVLAVLWPMAVYVGLITVLGIYAASAILIAYFMFRHGRYRWAPTMGVALGVPLFFFLVFERWFLVPLPKGPLERLLGF
jgi:hypothetical protein